MKILIVAHFSQMPEEKGNGRFRYIANLLSQDKENEVELITSSFSHRFKRQRNLKDEEIKKLLYKITNIYEPRYRKNVCLKRFYSHHIMAQNLKKYLNKIIIKPDVIYCAVPSLDVAKVTAKYAKKNNIRFIIDIQDLWPEAFKMVFNIPVISNLIFYPMKKSANYIYSNADEIIAVSETYCNKALKVNKNVSKCLSVFLGTDLRYFDECAKKNKVIFSDNLIRIAYIGTLGHSYDIKCVIDAIKILNNKGIDKLRFVVMGDGPLKQDFENYAKKKEVDCQFTGRLEYEKMVGLLSSCDIAINPITHGAAQSIINKVGDYAAAGLPVVNTQENIEYRKLVEDCCLGINVDNRNIEKLANAIEQLYKDQQLRNKLGVNNRKIAEKKFDREKTYKKIIEIIMG